MFNFFKKKTSAKEVAKDVFVALIEEAKDSFVESMKDSEDTPEAVEDKKVANYFKVTEFYSTKDTNLSDDLKTLDKIVDPKLLSMLNHARELDGKAWKVNSGRRSAEYNKIVGGVTGSAHVKGLAVDISAPTGKRKFEIVKAALEVGFDRIGIAKSFIHLDIDGSKPSPTIFLY